MITFHLISIFPHSLDSYINESILARAQEKKKIKIKLYNLRDFALDKHHKTDDRPYGGGPGMVMYAEPILRATKKAIGKKDKKKVGVFIMSPSGEQFTNPLAKKYAAKYTDIVIICGRYEGIDARVGKILKAKDLSVGPYVLTGGELPAAIIMDTVARQIPGVLGKFESLEEERVSTSEVYTRPEILKYEGRNHKVPPVLLSGHQKNIEEWKKGRIDKAS